MMNASYFVRSTLVACTIALVGLTGCPAPQQDGSGAGQGPGAGTGSKTDDGGETAAAPAEAPEAAADADDVKAATARLDEFGEEASYKQPAEGLLTEIVIKDGSGLTPEDVALFGKLNDLETLQIYNYRELNDDMASQLSGLENLTSLALTNTVIGDSTVQMIADSFPALKILDLSSNTNMSNAAMKTISRLENLDRLLLVQNRFNDLGTIHLEKLQGLRVLDLRGNMEAGDLTMEVVGGLPNLVAFKHRSTTVSDYGMESLAATETLESLFIQDFAITDQTGQIVSQILTLRQLEIFRCPGFGSQGVLPLKGTKLTRLMLRDLPMVDDQAMEVFTELPELRRLFLHELASVTDYGLENLKRLESLEQLDIWEIPQMTDATVDVIAQLPNLKELSIRATGITDAAVDKILEMPKLESLTLNDNGSVSDEALEKLASKDWKKLDIGDPN